MKSKNVGRLLAVLLSVSLLAGCGQTGGNEAATGSENDKVSSKEEVYTVTMTYPTGGTEPQDLKKIEQNLSEITLEKINCKVELLPVSSADQSTKYNMWFANDTKVDVIVTVFADYVSMINAGAFNELDELLPEYGKDLLEKDKEKNFLNAGTYKGKQYGLPVIPSAPGNGGAIYMRKDVYDKLDLTEVNTEDYLDYEELDNIFKQVHEKCPEYDTLGISGTISESNYFYLKNYDNLGISGGSCGVLLDACNSPKIENLFASDAYYEYAGWMRKWYQDGYISKDAATSTENGQSMFYAGRNALTIAMSTTGVRENMEEQGGFEVVQLDLCPNYMTTNVYTGCMFFIPKNSQNPEKTMEFLNLLFTDAQIQNLLTYGIEGEHYTVQDNGKVIDYTENRDKYICPFGVWGDQSQQYVASPQTEDILKEREEYLQVSLDHTSKAYGYQFDATQVSTEQSAVKSVITKYLTQLEYGSVDLDTVYPEFLEALKTAGIDKIIETNQQQLDAWLAQQ